MYYLKQSTASQEVLLGPFVDSTDGVTAETGLTIANTDIKIHVAGATTLANKNSGGATHISAGNYYAVLDATDTATLGSGCIIVQVSGALAVRVDICILAANVYDSLIGGGDILDVSTTQFNGSNVTAASGRPEVNVSHFGGSAGTFASGVPAVNAAQISGDSTAADNLETAFDDTAGAVPWQGIVDQGTAQSATGTTLVLRSAAAFANDELIGATIVITGGSAGVGQSRTITDYVGATDTATVDTWTTTPTGTITYKIYATAAGSGGAGGGDATEAKQDTIIGLLGTPAGASVSADIAAVKAQTAAIETDTQDIQSRIPAALVGGRIDATVDGTGMEAGAVTAIQSGLATSAALATTDGKVDSILADTADMQPKLGTPAGASMSADIAAVKSDTAAVLTDTGTTLDGKIDAIKAKTDSLTFTVAGQVDANTESINATTVLGTGTGGDLWRG